jgi:hypothetical protein
MKTFGLKPRQLADLLGIGCGRSGLEVQPDTNELKKAMLSEKFAAVLPLDPDVGDSLPAVLGRPCRELLSITAKPLSDILTDPKTDISIIEIIKDYGKRLAASEIEPFQQAIALMIYYSAIAAALVYHNQKISAHSYESLDHYFSMLLQKGWMLPELVALFTKARKVCQKKGG